MKKILCLICLALLVGCIHDSDSRVAKKWQDKSVFGVAQRGFFIEADDYKIIMGELLMPDYSLEMGTDSSPVEDVVGNYSLKERLRSSLVELHSMSRGYVDTVKDELVEDMYLRVVADLDRMDSVNLNYLTTLAHERILYYLKDGDSYEEARLKANVAVLKSFHMPTDLTDFEHYSLYGTGEGDAMLIAMSIVIERYFLSGGTLKGLVPLEFDSTTGEFVTSKLLSHFARSANDLILGNGLDTIREIIRDNSPDGKVPNIEKYLSILFGLYDKNETCDAANEGKLADYEFEYSGRLTYICKDSVWRMATMDDFDESLIFNPNVEYGTLVDPRDGRSYRTVMLGSVNWMAENLRYSDSVASENLKGQSWCYDNDERNCAVFGRLYTWPAAMDLPAVYQDSVADGTGGINRGICPEGWHVPTMHDFNVMIEEALVMFGEERTLFSAFMSTMKNETGASLIRGGYADREYLYDGEGNYFYSDTVVFKEMGREAYMWSDNQESYTGARIYDLRLQTESCYCSLCNEPGDKHMGAYVRCVMDYEPKTY